MLNNVKLRFKLVIIGVVVTMMPLAVILTAIYVQNKKVVRIGEDKSLQLAYADLEHIVDNLYTLAESHQEVTQKNIDASLKVAADLMSKAGAVSFGEEKATWNAKNQFSDAVQSVQLPKMMLGTQWLGQIADPKEPVAVVDPVQQMLDVTCTIFQRMNPQGDMLRVATNVVNKEGKRAIGAYIPAANPNGGANPVAAAVLKGETYRGRAFVVNAWYITAYVPIYDAGRAIVGMLYVGIPQENVKSLRQAIVNMKIGKTGYVTVTDGGGAYVIARQEQENGKNVKDARDAEGKAYIQERMEAAKALSARAVGKQRFAVKGDGGANVIREARFVYFAPWDWIIAVEANQAEFSEASEQIAAVNHESLVFLDIKKQIDHNQGATETTRVEIDAISSVIENVNAIVATIASAVNEQSASTRDISENIAQASQGIQEVNENVSQSSAVAAQIAQDITTVNSSAGEISESSGQVKASAEALSKMAKELNAIIGRFKTS